VRPRTPLHSGDNNDIDTEVGAMGAGGRDHDRCWVMGLRSSKSE